MPTDVLKLRALNRALLARQFLLEPSALPEGPGRAGAVIGMVEHLAGLQAQAPFPPYYGLWSRLAGFRPGDLADLLVSRQVVRIALMRATIHLVSARDCLTFRPLLQPVLDRSLPAFFGKQLTGLDTGALAEAGRALVDAEPRTFGELGGLLAPDWPGHPPNALAQGVRTLVPLVQVPPRAVWGAAGQSRHTSAEAWLGSPLDPSPAPEVLITRYLGAFGPATVADVQAWSGLTRLAEVVDRLRPGLRTFRDERGRELFDLPDALRPAPGTPAPVRLVAEFDNLVLSHADRARVISPDHRRRLNTRNGIFPGTVLVDGFVAGCGGSPGPVQRRRWRSNCSALCPPRSGTRSPPRGSGYSASPPLAMTTRSGSPQSPDGPAEPAHDSCTPEQVRAYDRLILVEPSELLSSLRGAMGKSLHHYRIYFDEAGCLDVIAEDFVP